MQTAMEKKMRNSVTRNSIYEYLCGTKAHPSAEMIYFDLRETNPNLSLGTVYRNLKLLEELGKIRRVTSYQGTERYDAICGDHAHFLCQRCGMLQDLSCADSLQIRQAIHLKGGYTVSKLDITITGICPNCAE